jgi:hypothetical protein
MVQKSKTAWFELRLLVYAISFLWPFLPCVWESPFGGPALQWPPPFVDSVVAKAAFAISIGLICPFVFYPVISLQAVNQSKPLTLKRPTHTSNPFSLTNPLPPLHFLAWGSIAMGTGAIGSSLRFGSTPLWLGVTNTSAGIGILGVLHLYYRFHGERFSE